MTKRQLAILATLPQVIDAVEAFNLEAAKLKAAMGGVQHGPVGRPSLVISPVPAGPSYPVNLSTPEREEFKAGNPPATEEDAVGLNQPTLPHLQEAKQRRADALRASKMNGERQSKLAQFQPEAEI